MYLVDYHVHSHTSTDAHNSMAEMAHAAVLAGMREICFTNHVEMYNATGEKNYFDWNKLAEEYPAAEMCVGSALTIRRGFEVGEVLRDPQYTETVMSGMPPVDFIIASQHKLSTAFGSRELYATDFKDPALTKAYLEDYMRSIYGIVDWGQFDVMAHLTLPVRYMRRQGVFTTFDAYGSDIKEIFGKLISQGKGIELNTGCGELMLPEDKWIRLYRECGGEIITVGADGHSTDIVGRNISLAQKILKDCGYKFFATYKDRKPIFHRL